MYLTRPKDNDSTELICLSAGLTRCGHTGLGRLCQLLLVAIPRPLVASNGLERTGPDFKPSKALVLKLGLILSALRTRPKDNDGTEPICHFPTGYCGLIWYHELSPARTLPTNLSLEVMCLEDGPNTADKCAIATTAGKQTLIYENLES